MPIYTLQKEEVFSELGSAPVGLSREEAKSRLKKYGPNEIKEIKKTNLPLRFLANFTNFFALLLWFGGGLSFIGGMPELGWAIFAVICINAVFSFWQEYKAEKATEALKKILPSYAKVIRNGEYLKILSSELVPGDLVVLEEGDNISADGRLIEEFEMRTNNSTLTGEAAPMRKTADPVSKEGLALIEMPNLVFAGTTVATGGGKAVVTLTGMNTEFGKIAYMTQAVAEELSPLQKEMGNVVRFVTVVSIGMGLLFFVLGRFVGKLSFIQSFLFMVGIIVANVPEGLLPTITMALAMGAQRMAGRKALIKKLSSVETLGATNIILTDKTGTLTKNEMTVREIWTKSEAKLYKASVIVNNAKLTPEGKMLGDPTEGALLVAAKNAGFDLNNIWLENPRLYLLPFDSNRKRMTSINLADNETIAYLKGAPSETMKLCKWIQIGDELKELTKDLTEEISNQNDIYARSALRVLAVAYRKIPQDLKEYNSDNVETDLIFLGLVAMMDPPRPEVEAAVKVCERAGIRVIMITGDYGLTAESIARKIGIIKKECRIITGAELEKITDEELRTEIYSKEVLFARANPEHKLRIVSILKEDGKIVAVTGDGVNDAPALKKADIGVAMGIAGTDVAKEASEMILLDDNFATIVAAIEEGRAIYANIKKFSTYILASNVPEVFPFIAFIMLRIPLPLTIMQILTVDLGTDIMPALGLATEKPEPGIMDQPPRARNVRLFNLPLLLRAYGFLGMIEGFICLAAFYLMYILNGWRLGQPMAASGYLYAAATTMCLASIVASQIGNIFSCRTERESIFKIGFHTNRLVLFGILVELILLNIIIYFPPFQKIFNTAPIGLINWAVLLIFPPIVLFMEEGRKLIIRLWYNKRKGQGGV